MIYMSSSTGASTSKIMSSILPSIHPSTSIHERVTSAEVKFTVFLLEHNLPHNVAGHVGPLFRSDSKVAKHYGCARTKMASIINGAMATEVMELVHMQPFTLCVDGSNDKEKEKLIPLTVRIFDLTTGRVVSKFLEMCLSMLGTAGAYFEKMEEVFVEKSIPWQNYIALSVDSCSINHNIIRTWLQAKYPSLYTLGYPCHFIHNAAYYGAKLERACGFDVEEVAVEILYYFD